MRWEEIAFLHRQMDEQTDTERRRKMETQKKIATIFFFDLYI